MFGGSNFKNLLFGGTRERELRETRRAWDDLERQWRRTPRAKGGSTEYAVGLVKEVVQTLGRCPTYPILVAAVEAVVGLLDAEDSGKIEPVWSVVENDIDAALEFRQMLSRRRRWVSDYRRMDGIFRRVLIARISEFFSLLPESCFADVEPDAGSQFEVSVLDVLDDPTLAVQLLFLAPYDDEALSCHVFDKLRERFVRNILIASGFPPTDHPSLHEGKLIMPSKQKDKTAPELADLYLGGTPLKALLDVPVPFGVPDELRFEHCHIIGGTGHGKTQLLQKLIHADLIAAQKEKRSVVVIDSQGDLIGKIQRLELFSPDIPGGLADRLVLIDPADIEYPAALNLFDAHLDRVRRYSAVDRERVLNGVIELYELFFGAFLGAELTQKQGVIFKYLARLMLAIPDATIFTLMQIMEDGARFKPYMDRLDGSARYFFESEFFQPSFAATKKQVLRRLWGVLSTPAFERMFTQPKNKLDLFEAMNDGKIILVSTAKDLLKREGSQLLGRFFIAMVSQAALERSTIPEYRRTPTFVYVDEAQEYFDDSIETILSQARKYRVGLTLAHQTLDQLSPGLRSAILSNTSVKCVGGVSSKDARALASELRTTPEFIEGMRRRRDRTEFAIWVKQLTGQAIRLSVPLGFLERQSTLADEDYDALLVMNRVRHCGTLAEITALSPPVAIPTVEPILAPAKEHIPKATPVKPQLPEPIVQRTPEVSPPRAQPVVVPQEVFAEPIVSPIPPPKVAKAVTPKAARTEPQGFGKGGPKHKYLQSLVKELAEQNGLKATIEAQLPKGAGQIDVLIERDGVLAAIEISVTTPAEHEASNIEKCLATGCPRIGVVLVKSKSSYAGYRATLLDRLKETDRERVAFLTPEEIPDFISSLAPPPEPTESIVKGYRVRTSYNDTSPAEAKTRREALARIIVGSMNERKE